jgi:diguanylate cyclase (GGDEF)-like protein
MTFQRITSSIVTRIILLGIVTLVLGSIVRWQILSEYLRNDLGRISATQQEALAKFVANDLDAKLVARKTILAQLAATLPVDLLGQPEALRIWLGERYRLQLLFDQGLFVTDTFGVPTADFPRQPEREVQKYADRDYFQGALKGELIYGKPVMGRVAKQPIIPLAAPVKDREGNVRAVLVGITSLGSNGFLSLPQTSALGEGSTFVVVSPRDHLVVASTQTSRVLLPTEPAGTHALFDKAMAGYRGTGTITMGNNEELIVGIASVPTTQWFVAAHIPSSQALATVAGAQRYIAANGLILTMGFLLAATTGLYVIFRPLFAAANHAERMALGQLPLAAMPVVRNDEVGHLTQAFNRLLAMLLQQQKDLARLAQHDPLTDLPNRTLLADRLQQALTRAHRSGLRVAVLYIDLDGFKPVNDHLGHAMGDLALKEVSRRLASTVRETDTLARMGGDEFMVVVGELDADRDHAEISARMVGAKCIEVFEQPIVVGGQPIKLGASIGIAIGSGHSDAEALRQAADEVMYRAKQNGGHRVELVSI